ncbi:MAG: FAD synthetase family protein [Treponema sp.]|jgi:riboflavin kinase/FMN adenylyltransferase|nr:FAD synthetase family protein [Treponema sp.]
MLVIDWSEFLENGLPLELKKASVTVGVFDGVHRGHQALIERIVSHNKEHVPVIITFRQDHKAGNIQTFRQKLAMFENMGIKITLAIDFTEDFRRMPGIEFLKILLRHCNVGFFAVGSGFRCGYQLDTGTAEINRFFTAKNIPVEIVAEVMEDGLPISSSRIRRAITSGNIVHAQAMLGYPYTIDSNGLTGIVLPQL